MFCAHAAQAGGSTIETNRYERLHLQGNIEPQLYLAVLTLFKAEQKPNSKKIRKDNGNFFARNERDQGFSERLENLARLLVLKNLCREEELKVLEAALNPPEEEVGVGVTKTYSTLAKSK